jgi:cytoskeletal protein CcmA (bactofilin family)
MTASVHPGPTARLAPEPGPGRESRVEAEPDFGAVAVPESARFEGLLTFRGRARVDGEIEGDILCRGAVRIGERGRVVGTIEADEVIVAGTLEGQATARDRLELTGTARVRGTVRAPRVHLEDGCQLEGRCESGTGALPAAPAQAD